MHEFKKAREGQLRERKPEREKARETVHMFQKIQFLETSIGARTQPMPETNSKN